MIQFKKKRSQQATHQRGQRATKHGKASDPNRNGEKHPESTRETPCNTRRATSAVAGAWVGTPLWKMGGHCPAPAEGTHPDRVRTASPSVFRGLTKVLPWPWGVQMPSSSQTGSKWHTEPTPWIPGGC